ncbi:hypothetical protein [Psychrobacillus sp. FSL H8-0487]|uniref:hypothetical protein n=1 Tax=Psychrobacillus sp. FSL H8-0487 TaxID=2921391 RepID=UPI0030F9757A
MNMKKILIPFLSLVLTVSVVTLPVYASKGESVVPLDEALTQEQFSYSYEGINFSGSTPLTEEELKNLYDGVVNVSPTEQTIGTFAEDNGDTTVTVVPPAYQTFNHTYVAATASFFLGYYVQKVAGIKNGEKFRLWANAMLSTWVATHIGSHYSGSWITSSWSNYQQKRIYHATLVHFAKSNYTQATDVEYYDVSQWYYQ